MILSSHATNARWEEFDIIAVVWNDEFIVIMYKIKISFTLSMIHHQKMHVYLHFVRNRNAHGILTRMGLLRICQLCHKVLLYTKKFYCEISITGNSLSLLP